jgi:hypothetical protein
MGTRAVRARPAWRTGHRRPLKAVFDSYQLGAMTAQLPQPVPAPRPPDRHRRPGGASPRPPTTLAKMRLAGGSPRQGARGGRAAGHQHDAIRRSHHRNRVSRAVFDTCRRRLPVTPTRSQAAKLHHRFRPASRQAPTTWIPAQPRPTPQPAPPATATGTPGRLRLTVLTALPSFQVRDLAGLCRVLVQRGAGRGRGPVALRADR